MRIIVAVAAVLLAWQMWSKLTHREPEKPTAHITLPADAQDKGYVKLGPEVDAAAQKAVEQFPDLNVPDSKLAKAFNVRLGRTFRDGGDRAFLEPSWPLDVAREEADIIARGLRRVPLTLSMNESKRRAAASYPDLNLEGSPLQRAFIARCSRMSPEELSAENWPERITAEEAAKLGIAPTVAN